MDDSNLVGVVNNDDEDDAALHPAPREDDNDGAPLPTAERRSTDIVATVDDVPCSFVYPADLSPQRPKKRTIRFRSVKQKTLTMTA